MRLQNPRQFSQCLESEFQKKLFNPLQTSKSPKNSQTLLESAILLKLQMFNNSWKDYEKLLDFGPFLLKNLYMYFLSAMSLRLTFKDLNSCPSFLLLYWDKILTKTKVLTNKNQLLPYSNGSADFNNVNKEFLPKHPPEK